MHLKAFERTAGPVSPSWHTAERLPSVKLPRRAATPFTWVSSLQALPSLPLEWSHLQPLLFIALSRLYFSCKTSNLCCRDPLSVIPLEETSLHLFSGECLPGARRPCHSFLQVKHKFMGLPGGSQSRLPEALITPLAARPVQLNHWALF